MTFQLGKYSFQKFRANCSWLKIKFFKKSNYIHFVWGKISFIFQWEYDCLVCKDMTYQPNSSESCQECCSHNEFDHYICLDCGYEKCPGEDIDAIEYALSDR